MKKAISIFGIIIIIYMICLFICVNYNFGILMGLFLGFGMTLLPFLKPTLFFNTIKIIYSLCICFFILMSIFIAIKSVINKADGSEDALVVLGCGLHGKELSANLKDRLDTALEYISKNPNVTIVVSGGQGPQEDITEAEAMYNYLVKNNVNSNNIIQESRSTSTNENFKFSKELLDKKLGESYTIAYITNDFHIYRAGKLAKKYSFNAKGYAAPTEVFSILPNYLRESLAILQYWIFNK